MLPHLPGVEGMLQGLDAHGKPPPLPAPILPSPVPSGSRPPLQHTHSESFLHRILDVPPHPRREAHMLDRSISTSLVSRTPRTFSRLSPMSSQSLQLHNSRQLPRLHSGHEDHVARARDADRCGSPSQSQSLWSSEESAFSDDSPVSRFAALPPQQDASAAEYEARIRRLTCQYCHKTFRRPSTLRTHENVHTREMEFWCTYPNCGKTYNVRGNAYRHVRRAHEVASMLEARKYVVTAGQRSDPSHRRHSLPG